MRMSEEELQELIAQVEDDGLIQAPRHMKQEILKRSQRVEHQLARETRQVSKNMQLLFYSLKVGAAVVTALLTLLLMPATLPKTEMAVPGTAVWEKEADFTEKLNQGLKDINQRFGEFAWEMRLK